MPSIFIPVAALGNGPILEIRNIIMIFDASTNSAFGGG
jgi:hypothetical protein